VTITANLTVAVLKKVCFQSPTVYFYMLVVMMVGVVLCCSDDDNHTYDCDDDDVMMQNTCIQNTFSTRFSRLKMEKQSYKLLKKS
jgi:hypothetical protein